MQNNQNGFTFKRKFNREMKGQWGKSVQNAVTIEMSLDQKTFYRRVYSGMDFIADLGGLFSAIRVSAS